MKNYGDIRLGSTKDLHYIFLNTPSRSFVLMAFGKMYMLHDRKKENRLLVENRSNLLPFKFKDVQVKAIEERILTNLNQDTF